MRRRTARLKGVHWEAAFIPGVSAPSGVFQIAHVKPASEKSPNIARPLDFSFAESHMETGKIEKKNG
jgi:hypothetical protein